VALQNRPTVPLARCNDGGSWRLKRRAWRGATMGTELAGRVRYNERCAGGAMSIFKDILNKLLHRSQPAQSPAGTATATPGTTSPVASPNPASPGATVPAGASAAGGAAKPLSAVDVEAVMDKAVTESGQQLNWRTSIVDTMKALGIDSSLEHRKELAKELNYTGDMNDSAAMNIWLHKKVMTELAANGGKLPPNLAS
jgi:hypothetical protein